MLSALKHAFRVLRHDPGFTTIAILSLALGIGATSAMYSFADAMLLRPLPVHDSASVVNISYVRATTFDTETGLSYPDYADLRDRNRTFDGMVAAQFERLGFTSDPRVLPHMKLGMLVSGNFFRVLGVEPALGRGFRPDEDQGEGRDPVVVLGHDFWVSQFGSSPTVLGSRIRLNGIDFTVIGVAPEHFTGIDIFLRPTLFIPMAMASRLAAQDRLHDRDLHWLTVKGRLKAGVAIAQAQADVAGIAAAFPKLHKQGAPHQKVQVESEFDLRVKQSPPATAWTIMLVILAICVWAVSCANVAGLLLSRARARSRETAIRLAIGAGSGALVRQLLLENLIVAVAGGALGLFVAQAIARFFRSMPMPWDVPIVFDMKVDYRVLLFTLAASFVTTLVFGLAPAWRITHPDLVSSLKSADADSAGKRRLWGRNLIVAGQVALSLVLLAVSTLLIQGFSGQLKEGPGFRTDHIFLTRFDTDLARYSHDQAVRFYDNLLRNIRAAGGVRSAALTTAIPMLDVSVASIFPEGYSIPRGQPAPTIFNAYVSEGYFETINIPILRGRGFRESDRENSPLVAVVNEHLARHFWPKGDALGKTFHLGETTGDLVQIVGVAKMAKYLWIAENPSDYLYLAYRQNKVASLALMTQSVAPDAASVAPTVREIVRGLDADMPVFDVRTMQDFYWQRAVKTPSILTQVVVALGLMGLVLALVGLYGLVAYSVSRRTREIGIRIAIGADQGRVIWMVLKQGLTLGSVGVAAGLVAAIFACRLVSATLWSGTALDMRVVNYALIALPLIAVSALAAFAPARRASRVDPMRALRDE